MYRHVADGSALGLDDHITPVPADRSGHLLDHLTCASVEGPTWLSITMRHATVLVSGPFGRGSGQKGRKKWKTRVSMPLEIPPLQVCFGLPMAGDVVAFR
jgi:hypothetical protein